MSLKISINKDDDMPVYRQIIEQITQEVKDGKLNAGDRLPPERDLSLELGVARGTVKKAYEKLAGNNVIEMVQGRGSFISAEQNVLGEGRKDKAVKIISSAIDSLEKLKFNPVEIRSLFQILLMEHEQRRDNIHVAGIDCNPEALSLFDNQLRHISNLQLFKFLLDDVINEKDVKDKLAEFDLILTTSTHYAEIIGVIPELKDKIIQAAVSPGQQTVIELAQIPVSAKVGIITESKNFFKIIKGKLKEFQIDSAKISHLNEGDSDSFPEFIKNINVLITPPKCMLEARKDLKSFFQNFTDKGGKLIRFGYQIERGTLINIEDRISQIVQGREG
ncbi:MAG: GntR family transcriptional regulator [Planctomycetota bacterium]|jgi:DNA-binding transcriptional regulator YhcF (GntR family)